jgi:hypothetical protein
VHIAGDEGGIRAHLVRPWLPRSVSPTACEPYARTEPGGDRVGETTQGGASRRDFTGTGGAKSKILRGLAYDFFYSNRQNPRDDMDIFHYQGR